MSEPFDELFHREFDKVASILGLIHRDQAKGVGDARAAFANAYRFERKRGPQPLTWIFIDSLASDRRRWRHDALDSLDVAHIQVLQAAGAPASRVWAASVLIHIAQLPAAVVAEALGCSIQVLDQLRASQTVDVADALRRLETLRGATDVPSEHRRVVKRAKHRRTATAALLGFIAALIVAAELFIASRHGAPAPRVISH